MVLQILEWEAAVSFLRDVYRRVAFWSRPLIVSLVLLLLRCVWGWGFYQAGSGKLAHIQKPIGFFHQLGIPFPTFSAWLVSIVEAVGGILLLVGLGARAACVALAIDMLVAYCTADWDAVKSLFANQDATKFAGATPFWFLLASLVVLALGPGWFSIDALVKHAVVRRSGPNPRAAAKDASADDRAK